MTELKSIDNEKPNVMCFSGLDPSGGAGLQADIETLFSTGCHCLPICTSITVQSSQEVVDFKAVDPTLLIEQARSVLEDIPVHAFKIGLLSSTKSIEVLHTILSDYPGIPVVFDPIIRSGGGQQLASAEIVEAMRMLLLPLTTITTPNMSEIRELAPSGDGLDACATEIMDAGCEHILLTGTHAPTDQVINRLYSRHKPVATYEWERLKEEYHGSGCTLAACLAGYLAHQLTLADSVQTAQRFCWESLKHGYRTGMGQLMPNRSYWTKRSGEGFRKSTR